ncbi:DNA polymerase III subunit beta [Massiliimalia massiliensis]|uniref:DNA polymerase III subunit beta n=1 Tax=Massiliimalia massiliensis TaxID=1852384 RepID=UPI000986D720|nr:DNA polymerase III subunit beta [Massiliimalia massiliensis]
MKFSCDKSLLCETINNVSLAVASKSSIISLEGILMHCESNSLTLTGFNLELGIIKTIPVHSEEDGEIVLTASLLSNIVNKMPDGQISFDSNEKMLTVIRCNDAEFTILGLSSEDYPEIPVINDDRSFSISQEIFKSVVGQTLFAVAQTNQNPIYTGSLFDIDNNQLTVVAVDGCRLAIRKELLELSSEEQFHFIVPGKTLSEIMKLLAKLSNEGEEEEPMISMRVSNRHIIFELAGYSIISRLLEGEFLDYKSAIPNGVKTKVVVNTREFINSINRASIIINERAQSPIKCEIGGNIIRLNCESTLGKVQDSFEAQVEGNDVKIGFNNKFMYDALRASESDTVLIEINEPYSPMKVMPMDGDSFLFLVMPIRL